ncbi:MAG: hypothetical protein CM15mP73_5270 [Hyphomicrobiales bacterium]|nr:MAG: hypothetical protein CM15mP73_5270 [Hyphomicrobiales bacterium]
MVFFVFLTGIINAFCLGGMMASVSVLENFYPSHEIPFLDIDKEIEFLKKGHQIDFEKSGENF